MLADSPVRVGSGRMSADMAKHHRNENLRKVCGCRRSQWPKCPHSWFINFKPAGRSTDSAWMPSSDGTLPRKRKPSARWFASRLRFWPAPSAGPLIYGHSNSKPGRRPSDRPRWPGKKPTLLEPPDHTRRFVRLYLEDAVQTSGKVTWDNDKSMLTRLRHAIGSDGRRLGDWPLAAINVSELEAFHAGLRVAGLAASTRNQYVQVLKAAFRWAAAKGLIRRSPLAVAAEQGVLRIKRVKVAQRRRRLSPEEESKLLAAAGRAMRGAGFRLQHLVIAALESGARRGELLALRWADVNLEARTALIRAVEQGAKKTCSARELPISGRLAAVLEMAHDQAKGANDHPNPGRTSSAMGSVSA